MLDLHFSGSADEVIADMKKIMPALIAGTPLPPMQEQPKDDPQPQKTRQRKAKEAEEKQPDPTPAAESTAVEAATEVASTSAEISDIEDLRAALKKLGATDGHGSDAVFKLLGEYGAKNASTVPEAKRAEVIGKINGMLA